MESDARYLDARKIMEEKETSIVQGMDQLWGMIDQLPKIMYPVLEMLCTTSISSPYLEEISEAVGNLATIIASPYVAENNDLFHRLREIASAFIESLLDAEIPPNELIEIPDSTLHTIQELSPLVPEDKREEFEEIVAPTKATELKILTIENIKWLLGIIIPILFSLYLSYLPDKNAEEQIQLHKESNEIGREIVESLERGSEEETVKEFLKYLNDNGFILAKKDEIIYDHSEEIPNCVSVLGKDVDALDDTDLVKLETDDLSNQSTDQDGQN